MKFAAIPCLFVAGMVASSSIAQEPDANIEVLAPSTVEAWSKTVNRDLDQNIDQEIRKYRMTRETPTGAASVRFLCSENGEPTAIELTQRSPNRLLNKVARDAVADIKSLHPLPLGVGPDQVFVANIVVASDEREYERHMAALNSKQQRQTTMAGKNLQPIALSVAFRAPG